MRNRSVIQNFDGDAAIFPIICRANHSCVPNADFVTRGDRRVQEVSTPYLVQLENSKFKLQFLLSFFRGKNPPVRNVMRTRNFNNLGHGDIEHIVW